MSKIKILYLTTSSQMAGAEKMLFELVQRINREKFEVLVCTIKGDNDGLLLNLKKKKIQVRALHIKSKWQFLKVVWLFKIIKDLKPDILQSFLFFDNLLARIFGRLCKVPVVISGQRNVETQRSSIRNFLDKITLPLADFVISNTRAGKKILIEREKVNPKKIIVIPNGIDLQKIPPFLNKKERNKKIKEMFQVSSFKFQVVGFVGYLTEQKGLEYLLEAFSQLREEDAFLLIIGDGPCFQKLKIKAQELKIDKKALFLGYKKDVLNYLRLFDIFCLPSLWEGQPNVILEAMGCGLPIVATRVGGVQEMIKDKKNGILVPPANSKALFRAIELLLKNESLRRKMGQAALNSVKKYDIESMVSQYENLYPHTRKPRLSRRG